MSECYKAQDLPCTSKPEERQTVSPLCPVTSELLLGFCVCVCGWVHTFSLRVFILRPPINFPPSDSAMVSAPPNNVLLKIKDANVE